MNFSKRTAQPVPFPAFGAQNRASLPATQNKHYNCTNLIAQLHISIQHRTLCVELDTNKAHKQTLHTMHVYCPWRAFLNHRFLMPGSIPTVTPV